MKPLPLAEDAAHSASRASEVLVEGELESERTDWLGLRIRASSFLPTLEFS